MLKKQNVFHTISTVIGIKKNDGLEFMSMFYHWLSVGFSGQFLSIISHYHHKNEFIQI